MKNIVYFFIFCCLLPNCVQAATVEHRLNVGIGFFDAARVSMTYNLDKQSYEFASTVKTAGTFGKLYLFEALYSSEGIFKDGHTITRDYRYETKSSSHLRTKQLVFDENGVLDHRLSSKDGKPKRVEITLPDTPFDASDLQTVFASVARQIIDNNFCAMEKTVFDGKKNYKVVFKDEGYLLDQKNFAKLCIRFLNSAPLQVSNNDWYAVLNTVLPNIEEVEVSQETDTSGKALLRTAFLAYLSNKMAHNDRPYQIHVGLCFRQKVVKDGTGLYKYFFTHQGFADYLKNQKISFDASLLREMLLSFGAEEDVLVYNNAIGEERRCNCWSKVEDKDINEAYTGMLEVEEGDRYFYDNSSVSDASNTEDKEEEVKPYTEEDMKNAEEMF